MTYSQIMDHFTHLRSKGQHDRALRFLEREAVSPLSPLTDDEIVHAWSEATRRIV